MGTGTWSCSLLWSRTGTLAARLERALSGRGVFRRFKDVLAESPTELQQWYAFSDERERGRARAWLATEGYATTA